VITLGTLGANKLNDLPSHSLWLQTETVGENEGTVVGLDVVGDAVGDLVGKVVGRVVGEEDGERVFSSKKNSIGDSTVLLARVAFKFTWPSARPTLSKSVTLT
jgi:hypothetical protein